ncbi:SH2 domain containing 1A duplicate a [Neoarius graeffei]|uniref:SH2 domain containing 1A duplicate a n=1 Tax=Neoarius graeffei TaxID=443677 RepID=UPI00298C9EA9|nr:SH2 domain containing 1A duplicate a [Neoarius graeffei]
MEELAMYHGAISKEQAERILGATGRDGSFLIRDSKTIPGSYCICVLCDQHVFTYRLFQVEGKVWKAETAPGVKERLFRNIQNLLAVYREPNQGIATPLQFPVNNDQAQCTKPCLPARKHIPC